MSKISTPTPFWKTILLFSVGAALILVALPLVVVVMACYLALYAFVHTWIWTIWRWRKKDVLFVYSDSPIWKEYIEAAILPQIRHRAIILNWSTRKKWRITVGSLAFRALGGTRNFNPLGVVFLPWHKAEVFRFFSPFKNFKHGDPRALQKMEAAFFSTIAEGSCQVSDYEKRPVT